jgi:predicted nucleotidyltransferase component of viral defense system
MLNRQNLEQFAKLHQSDMENVVREYCQHLFLSFLYQEPGSERILFKGGTALRIILHSPRFSEDLDFTGVNITSKEVEDIFTAAFSNIEKSGIEVEIEEGKPTTGGYLSIIYFHVYDLKISIRLEVSLRRGRGKNGTRTVIQSDYIPPYTLVHVPIDELIKGKIEALEARSKPRDFYDFFFLLCGNYPQVKEKRVLMIVQKLVKNSRINFRAELRKFLPAGQARQLRDFKKILLDKITVYKAG